MYSRNDPRLRQRLNELSQTIESANETAQVNIFTFANRYVNPCISSLGACFRPCTECYQRQREQRRLRSRRGASGRAEQSFDFYDDWADEENDAMLGWVTSERDGLLSDEGGPSDAVQYGTSTQPGHSRQMNYNARKESSRKESSFFATIASRLSGSKSIKYRPSAADLQDNPRSRKDLHVTPVHTERSAQRKGRKRSATTGSGVTADSFSSRGDIFPSDDEDDAVPLDDEFAVVLERRTTNSVKDDASSGKYRTKGQREGEASQLSSRTGSSMSLVQSRRSSRLELNQAGKDIDTFSHDNLDGEGAVAQSPENSIIASKKQDHGPNTGQDVEAETHPGPNKLDKG